MVIPSNTKWKIISGEQKEQVLRTHTRDLDSACGLWHAAAAVIAVERGNRVVHCPGGICVLFIRGAERQEGEAQLVECWGGYKMIEDVCPHVCNSLGWVEGLGGGRERIKE